MHFPSIFRNKEQHLSAQDQVDAFLHPPGSDNRRLSPTPTRPTSSSGSSSGGSSSHSSHSSHSPAPQSAAPITRSPSSTSIFHKHHKNRSVSHNLPLDLPAVTNQSSEAQWEARATALTHNLALPRSLSMSRPAAAETYESELQNAIRLHEQGNLKESTELFAKLADPEGPNQPLSQVMYGLALRHGWGIEPNQEQAMIYLKSAAKLTAEAIESRTKDQQKNKEGIWMKKELILAIYELGNSFRQGWGVEKDPVAAREYYETAANLGDPDAQNEVAWCYENGFGGKKDKMKAARFYRMAEKQGSKTPGNSWIYKDKWMPKPGQPE
ncbi:hypothetical protein FPQ18DRAFT_11001 [Pyronema domesticum]|uniref:Similar to Protein DSF2 acc. no. P38213 n=1 Tax=Pyronema omphalodes (strain CBS 100304) TaxID=1076935 RepID=U4KUS3_PYROM|nr:hypothetical protein FPQ18DRAFT_11001 [Pyronema domesticum]CCX04526.1 Similar to Protein DSF2; acc. no. P38213 [Pyronema omphalodes CBS 100304]